MKRYPMKSYHTNIISYAKVIPLHDRPSEFCSFFKHEG